MPLTDKDCPNCGKVLHTDDLIEGVCIGQETHPNGSGCDEPLPDDMEW